MFREEKCRRSGKGVAYERTREAQVLTAEREGIHLTDTRRGEYGYERPVPDAEFRRALAEGRAPVAPEHTVESAIITAAEILECARVYESAGRDCPRERALVGRDTAMARLDLIAHATI